jgi:hypothetical protein
MGGEDDGGVLRHVSEGTSPWYSRQAWLGERM